MKPVNSKIMKLYAIDGIDNDLTTTIGLSFVRSIVFVDSQIGAITTQLHLDTEDLYEKLR